MILQTYQLYKHYHVKKISIQRLVPTFKHSHLNLLLSLKNQTIPSSRSFAQIASVQ